MSQIARLGAGVGFYQILATQYPTGDVIPRQCKQNSDGKLCFRVQSGTASRVVLDSDGAESLPKIKGRAIYQTADKRTIVQTPLITPEIIQKPSNLTSLIKGAQRLKPLTERQEKILLSLRKQDYLNRDQLTRIHRLGSVRNANRVLKDLSLYLSSFREDSNSTVYFLNKEGREYVGSEKIKRKTKFVNHYLMRNDFYIYIGYPHEWENELKISDGTYTVISDSYYKKTEGIISWKWTLLKK